jgi:hypothetical protein
MQTDATVADQYITYPTDNGILNESWKKCEKLIDKLYEVDGKKGIKPRTYWHTMDQAFLEYSKKKNKTSKGQAKLLSETKSQERGR